MKEKYFSSKYLISIIILFTCLFIFSIPSLALIPGDFGSAGGGPPDGCVDFEDLMIFAMAYGSTPPDSNWNEVCDIASQGGVLQPDGVVDFEDLMVFAMNYGRRDTVTNVTAITVISNTQRSNFVDAINKNLENKERFRQVKEENTHYHIYVHWSTCSEANRYKVYRKVNEGDFIEVFDGNPPPSSNWPGWKGHGWYDFDVQEGNIYSYYVIAYGTSWQTEPSEIATRYTWLPPCSLSSPSNGAIITTSEPTFSWNPVGLDTSDFPYGDICYGKTNLWMFDRSTDEEVWWSSFDGMTTSTATYNYDGNATPLVIGHSYTWCTLGHGYDENDNFIASSDSEWREFIYVGSEGAIISKVNAYTVTHHSDRAKYFIEATKLESGSKPGSIYYFNEPQGTKEGDIECGMRINWSAYLAASGCGYKVYKSVNGSSFTVVFSQEAPSGYDWYGWWDDDVAPGSIYSYYVTAYGGFGETLPSETVTRQTWLPPCSAISPIHNSIITDPNPVFTWNSTGVTTPYEDIDFGETILRVWDETSGGDDGPIWQLFLDGLTVSTVTYNQDGEAPPLIPGHVYSWNTGAHGYDEDLMAISWTENWQFYYGFQPLELWGQTWVEKHPDNNIEYAVRLYSDGYPDASTYHVYRYDGISENIEDFSGISGIFEFNPEDGSFEFWDLSITPGNTYSYYIIADLSAGGSSNPSRIIILDSWFSDFESNYPSPNVILSSSDVPITFSWSPPNNIYPGSVTQGDVNISIRDRTIGERIWHCTIEDLTATSSEAYGDDPDEDGLLDGHEYQWRVTYDGEIETGEEIANTSTERIFFYGYQPWEYRCAAHSGPGHIHAEIYWQGLTDANSYKILKGTDGTNFPEIFEDYESDGNNYDFNDNDVNEGTTYYYKIEAYDVSNNLIQTSDVLIINAWLPAMIADYPVNDEIVTVNTITFSWHDETAISFPYEGEYEFQDAGFILRNPTTNERIFEDHWDNYTTKSVMYNNLPLVEGNRYAWNHYICGGNGNRTDLASTTGGSFYYGYQPWEVTYRTETFSPDEQAVRILWTHYTNANDYQVYKSTDGDTFTLLEGEYEFRGYWYEFWDYEVIDGSTYYYYVKSFDGATELQTSCTMMVDTWLPGIIAIDPIEDEVVTDSTPTFIWQYENSISFPDGPFDFCQAGMNLYDTVLDDIVWEVGLNNLDIFSYTYDGPSLVEGRRYIWCRFIEGEGDDGVSTATAGRSSFFYVGGASAVISEVNAFTQVGNNSAQSSGVIEYLIEANIIPFFYQLNEDEISRSKDVYRHINIRWTAYLQESNCGYKVYKSTNGGIFTEVFSQLAPSGYDWYGWWDENVQEGNTYSYYVTAYGDTWETEPSETVTRDTWLPISYLESPIDGATINDPEPTFTWLPVGIADYPYEGTIYSGHTILRVYEDPVYNEDIWSAHSEDLTTSTFIYNQDGQAPSLISGKYYEWNVIGHGVDQEGELAAVSLAGNWGFTYIEN